MNNKIVQNKVSKNNIYHKYYIYATSIICLDDIIESIFSKVKDKNDYINIKEEVKEDASFINKNQNELLTIIIVFYINDEVNQSQVITDNIYNVTEINISIPNTTIEEILKIINMEAMKTNSLYSIIIDSKYS